MSTQNPNSPLTSAGAHKFEPYENEPAYCQHCDKHEGDHSSAFDSKQLIPGQGIAVRSGYGRGAPRFGYKVVSVTPKTGVTTVVSEQGAVLRFDRWGVEMRSGGQSRHSARLEVDVAGAREDEAKYARLCDARAAIDAVVSACGPGSLEGQESLRRLVDELQAKLVHARLMVEAIG